MDATLEILLFQFTMNPIQLCWVLYGVQLLHMFLIWNPDKHSHPPSKKKKKNQALSYFTVQHPKIPQVF